MILYLYNIFIELNGYARKRPSPFRADSKDPYERLILPLEALTQRRFQGHGNAGYTEKDVVLICL